MRRRWYAAAALAVLLGYGEERLRLAMEDWMDADTAADRRIAAARREWIDNLGLSDPDRQPRVVAWQTSPSGWTL